MARRQYAEGVTIPGTVYRVIRVLGEGGMGVVYDVEDITIGKRYVVKTLHADLIGRTELSRRMQTEARALARLHHPNIVDVITAGITADELALPYYVMERLSGQSLGTILDKRRRLDPPLAVQIAIDLLDAVEHAHDKGIIHRDIKPDNIFLHRTLGGVTVIKLLDFGIVSLLGEARPESANRFLGTARYAAPEQLQGRPASPSMDIYAAAVVLYEMLAGRTPFEDCPDLAQVIEAQLHRSPPRLADFCVVPMELERTILQALQKDITRRPKDAGSFAASLRNIYKSILAPKKISDPPAPGPLAKLSPPPASSPALPPIDRHAETRKAPSETLRMPRNGTEPLPIPRDPVSIDPVPSADLPDLAQTSEADTKELQPQLFRPSQKPPVPSPMAVEVAPPAPHAAPLARAPDAPVRPLTPALVLALVVLVLGAGVVAIWLVYRAPTRSGAPAADQALPAGSQGISPTVEPRVTAPAATETPTASLPPIPPLPPLAEPSHERPPLPALSSVRRSPSTKTNPPKPQARPEAVPTAWERPPSGL